MASIRQFLPEKISIIVTTGKLSQGRLLANRVGTRLLIQYSNIQLINVYSFDPA